MPFRQKTKISYFLKPHITAPAHFITSQAAFITKIFLLNYLPTYLCMKFLFMRQLYTPQVISKQISISFLLLISPSTVHAQQVDVINQSINATASFAIIDICAGIIRMIALECQRDKMVTSILGFLI
jgi:hypothetical protein